MAEKQKLFWISKKSSYGKGEKALLYGDAIEGVIPEELYPHFKETGEIGAIEMASPDNVEVTGALEKANAGLKKDLKAVEEKILKFQVVAENVVKALGQDKLTKPEKEELIKQLEALQ